MGRAVGMRLGRDVKVFSKMRAAILDGRKLYWTGNVYLNGKKRRRTFEGLRLTRSMATAPPIDCPYSILKESSKYDGL